jgi:hypothetical protein
VELITGMIIGFIAFPILFILFELISLLKKPKNEKPVEINEDVKTKIKEIYSKSAGVDIDRIIIDTANETISRVTVFVSCKSEITEENIWIGYFVMYKKMFLNGL